MEDLKAYGLTTEDIEIFRVNCALAEKIDREALADPTSPSANKFVGIANGEVVIVSDDPQKVHHRLYEIGDGSEPGNKMETR